MEAAATEDGWMDNPVFVTQPAPSLNEDITKELVSWSPRVFLVWEPRAQKSKSGGHTVYEGRWEIWVEVTDNIHPDHRHIEAEDDRWNEEHECWMRKLQTYQHADGSFAPVDARLVQGLRMADTWANNRYYKEHVEEPHRQKELASREKLLQATKDASKYYDNWDNPIIGPNTAGDWRHKTRSIS